MNKKKIDSLRDYYELPDSVTDEQISGNLKGSFGEVIVDMRTAAQNFKKAMAKSLPTLIKKNFK